MGEKPPDSDSAEGVAGTWRRQRQRESERRRARERAAARERATTRERTEASAGGSTSDTSESWWRLLSISANITERNELVASRVDNPPDAVPRAARPRRTDATHLVRCPAWRVVDGSSSDERSIHGAPSSDARSHGAPRRRVSDRLCASSDVFCVGSALF